MGDKPVMIYVPEYIYDELLYRKRKSGYTWTESVLQRYFHPNELAVLFPDKAERYIGKRTNKHTN